MNRPRELTQGHGILDRRMSGAQNPPGEATHSTATVRQHRFGFEKALSSPVGFG